MNASVRPKRKPAKIDTDRARAIRASARHLRDLKRAYAAPPADVRVCMTRIPQFLSPVPVSSYITSPALLCAELAE